MRPGGRRPAAISVRRRANGCRGAGGGGRGRPVANACTNTSIFSRRRRPRDGCPPVHRRRARGGAFLRCVHDEYNGRPHPKHRAAIALASSRARCARAIAASSSGRRSNAATDATSPPSRTGMDPMCVFVEEWRRGGGVSQLCIPRAEGARAQCLADTSSAYADDSYRGLLSTIHA